MTWFYVCMECGKVVGHGKNGKGAVEKIKVFGACCYNMQEEINEINDWRIKKGLDKQDALSEEGE